MSLAHPLRASVMRADEWFKDRDQAAWLPIKKQALHRDQHTCSYCLLICQKFMQVKLIGAEDDQSVSPHASSLQWFLRFVLRAMPPRPSCTREETSARESAHDEEKS